MTIKQVINYFKEFYKNFNTQKAIKLLTALELDINRKISIFTTTIIIIVCLFICYYSEANMQILKSILELTAETYNTTVLNLLLLVSFVLF